MTGTVTERFWAKVDKSGDCWVWTGSKNDHGYGQLRVRPGLLVKAHRLSWELHNGPIPQGLDCLHRCDNPPCVNPAHLWLGTAADNASDMKAKSRQWHRPAVDLRKHVPRGEEMGNAAKLNEQAVRDIRRRAGTMTNGALGREYGVGPSTIGHIVRGISWKHVK